MIHFDASRVRRGDAVNGNDLFAGEETSGLGRLAVPRSDNRGKIIADGEADADATRVVGLIGRCGLVGREQISFRVDGADESAERHRGLLAGVDARWLSVTLLHHLQQFREARQRLE
jgi:hypothetical protein